MRDPNLSQNGNGEVRRSGKRCRFPTSRGATHFSSQILDSKLLTRQILALGLQCLCGKPYLGLDSDLDSRRNNQIVKATIPVCKAKLGKAWDTSRHANN